ncbi:hypothetical protein ACWKWC_00620 [Geodermatophilus nigrescens]
MLAIAAAATVAATLWLARSSDEAADAGPPTAPPLTEEQAQQLAGQLADTDPAVVAPAIAEAVRAEYQASPAPLLPEGGTLIIDLATFTPGTEVGYATVQASAAGPQTGQFLVALVYEDQEWHVLATMPQ